MRPAEPDDPHRRRRWVEEALRWVRRRWVEEALRWVVATVVLGLFWIMVHGALSQAEEAGFRVGVAVLCGVLTLLAVIGLFTIQGVAGV